MLNNGFSRRLWRWLEGFGFTDDPFALYEADQEHSYLHYFFVDRPYLHGVVGNPVHPQTAFLMAGRGDGKTATREMVAYECAHAQLRRRALAVRYYDFSLLLEQVNGDPTQISARHHINAITRSTLKTLAEDVPATYFDQLEEMERALLKGYVVAFADPISRLKLEQILPDDRPIQLDWNELSPLELFENLVGIVIQLGRSSKLRYQALYILVDRVDETAAGPKAAVTLLKPLVSQGPLLEMRHVAFKFFLPIEIREELRQVVTLRPDRLYMRTITWNQTDLEKMVQQRLSHYSESRYERLEELCNSGAKATVMKRLIQACEGSPRTLLRLCQALIHHHVARTDDALIEPRDITGTLAEFGQQLETERTPLPSRATASIAPTRPTEPPESGLYLDKSGHVWIDGTPLSPPLSDLEFQLLFTLYRQAPEIVPNEALIEAVWSSSVYDKDEQNLRKLITRLRTRLATGAPNQRSRFVKNARGRGYWLKIR
jgi:hypothetical protein